MIFNDDEVQFVVTTIITACDYEGSCLKWVGAASFP